MFPLIVIQLDWGAVQLINPKRIWVDELYTAIAGCKYGLFYQDDNFEQYRLYISPCRSGLEIKRDYAISCINSGDTFIDLRND